ncbi:MAG: putative choloylglycine hydrolase [Planctomycetota bacterium]|jgi:predicted choloylglycine hydrolase
MEFEFALTSIDKDGKGWKENFERTWPNYKRWYLADGLAARPRYRSCLDALEKYMPELLPIYAQVCEWAGAGDLESRFLSLYNPPAYMAGCTQAVWHAPTGPILIRNYDYDPRWFEGVTFSSDWLQPVIGISDCAWGLLDGMNSSGLCASLTFGGSRKKARGFGIPLVIRYALEVCSTVKEAIEVFRRIPVHMTYNVTLLDASGAYSVLFLSPGGGLTSHDRRVCANHQSKVVWPKYEAITATRERETHLDRILANPDLTRVGLIGKFLTPPIYQSNYRKSFGTLYTTLWDPTQKDLHVYWPGAETRASFSEFEPRRFPVNLNPE